MGTLTAETVRLPGQCDHKLPTSCRLTSIPECCACADERAHAPSYSVYIDGIGFVPRGTRWQRYCWFCKEFWENRVAASGLRPAQTRIPETPDQTIFLDRWYEFHRGYRLVQKDDGTEERVAVLGEEFREVSPGHLPRTLEDLRAGRGRNMMDEVQQQVPEAQIPVEAGPTLEDTLDSLFLAASAEESQQNQPNNQNRLAVERTMSPVGRETANVTSNVHAQAMTTAVSRNQEYQARRVAALRRELSRMRNGIERVLSGLRELGEEVPNPIEATRRLTDLSRTLDTIDGTPSQEDAARAIDSIDVLTANAGTSQVDRTLANVQIRIDSARQHVDEARRARDQAASELDLADQEFRTSQQRLQQLQREARTTENYIRLFGTREEMAAQGENYESPIGAMFSRAYDRFRVAEQVRQDERTLRQVLEDEARTGGEIEMRRLAELDSRDRDVWGVPRPPAGDQGLLNGARDDNVAASTREESALQDYNRLLTEAERSASDQGRQPQPPLEANAAGRQRLVSDDRPSTNDEERAHRNSLRYESVTDDRLRALMLRNGQLARPETTQLRDIGQIINAWPESLRTPPMIALSFLLANERSLEGSGWSSADLREIAGGFMSTPSARHRTMLDEITSLESIAWAAGLPSARLAVYRSVGPAFEVNDAMSNEQLNNASDSHAQDCVEWMAEAYQMSSSLRARSGLTPPERLPLLYRLQAGERRRADRDVLEIMLQDQETVTMARDIHRRQISARSLRQISAMDRTRQERAREGDFSRGELDAQRQATQALAVAAGRTAMLTGPQALLEHSAGGFSDSNGAALSALRMGQVPDVIFHDFTSEADDGSDAEDFGLDAPDSGRPAAKADEEMTVRMDCRICYTQLAEIACLPCGHLVMCRWCSDQHSPTMQHDRTRPRRVAGCPVCRKGIRQKVRVFRA